MDFLTFFTNLKDINEEYVGYQGKPAFKTENGTYAHGGSLSTCILTANNTSHEPASYRLL